MAARPNTPCQINYFGGSTTTFRRTPAAGGTDLELTEGIDPLDCCDVIAGWVSVLLALKGAVDHETDPRNHDPERSWAQGYADN